MIKISNVKIGNRLALGFAVIVALLVMVALVGMSQIVLLNRAANTVLKERVPQVLMAQEINNNLNVISSASRSAILMTEESLIKTEIMVIDEANNEITEALNNLEKLLHSEAERTLYKEVTEARAVFTEATERLVKLALKGEKEEAIMVLSGEVSTAYFAYTQSLGKFTESLSESVEKAGEMASNTFVMASLLMLVFAVSAVIVSIVASCMATRSITRPLNEVLGIAETVASGDLTSRIDVHSKDETGRIMQALQALNSNLMMIVSKVRHNTEAITTVSAQIAAGNQELSIRTERQAGTLEETVASMDELTSTVRRNSDNAHRANQLALNAAEVAVKGGEAVMEVVQRMREIHASSKKIEDIISVIDSIAFQTNILALNAAVEAARAGEQGRGFAVVASEVRALAQRSALAAKEIKILIHESVDKVGAGNVLAEQAGTTMEDVVSSIKRANGIMNEITQASREQNEGIEQINQAMMQMEQVTQQNTALAEESVAAVNSLHQQTLNLLETVSVFKMGDAVKGIKAQEDLTDFHRMLTKITEPILNCSSLH